MLFAPSLWVDGEVREPGAQLLWGTRTPLCTRCAHGYQDHGARCEAPRECGTCEWDSGPFCGTSGGDWRGQGASYTVDYELDIWPSYYLAA